MTTQLIPEIERAALTILAQARVYHPQLAQYVELLTTDMGEQRYLDDIEVSNAIRQNTPWARFSKQTRRNLVPLFGLLMDGEAFNEDKASPLSAYSWGFVGEMDAATARLASAVASFRRAGRPQGDVTREVRGMGTPVAYVTTSLAAAIAEYVQNIACAWADEHHA